LKGAVSSCILFSGAEKSLPRGNCCPKDTAFDAGSYKKAFRQLLMLLMFPMLPDFVEET
jgi:hypothetical protein